MIVLVVYYDYLYSILLIEKPRPMPTHLYHKMLKIKLNYGFMHYKYKCVGIGQGFIMRVNSSECLIKLKLLLIVDSLSIFVSIKDSKECLIQTILLNNLFIPQKSCLMKTNHRNLMINRNRVSNI